MSVSDSWRWRGKAEQSRSFSTRAGLILSNPETVRADVPRQPRQLAAEYYRDVKRWKGEYIVTYHSGQESVHLIHEFKG